MSKVPSFIGLFALAATFTLGSALAPSTVEGGEPQPSWIEVHPTQACNGPSAKGFVQYCREDLGYQCLTLLRPVDKDDDGRDLYRCGRASRFGVKPPSVRSEQKCHKTTNQYIPQGECGGGYLCLDGLASTEKDDQGQPLYSCGTFYLPSD